MSWIERFWSKVRKTKGCWIWTATCTSNGYGQFTLAGKKLSAHRVAYKLKKGPIPRGLYVCHECDNRKCVRPGHLFLGTNSENILDSVRKGRFGIRNQKGILNSNSRMTEKEIRAVRKLADAGVPQRQIAKRFGLNRIYVSRLKRRKAWKHLA